MRGVVLVMLVVMTLPAAAQDGQPGFPVDKAYSAISIGGLDVQEMALTMTVARQGGGFRGSGRAGCNRWNANVKLIDNQIEFTEIVTTKMLCPEPRMTAENALLTSLKSAKRWHVDGDRLIIEGDAARLLLNADAAKSKR